MKLSDIRPDSWLQIIKKIERGDRPADQYLSAALMRGEPLTPEQQRGLAKLFDGSLRKGRGRPRRKNEKVDKVMARQRRQNNDLSLYLLVTEIAEELQNAGAEDPLGKAIQKVAVNRSTLSATVRRQYRRGERLHITE